ncbi:hypothetical protein CEXT_501051 [Caerostris extrusa]|uniref:Uncharacterized protein n=1 Tax=Caerostris extrusa TaxID=172846 RepID=A0AAV4MQT0_CAEEX|nr:hypothetical protein CEXT_501051 [Caerostris extrusa]
MLRIKCLEITNKVNILETCQGTRFQDFAKGISRKKMVFSLRNFLKPYRKVSPFGAGLNTQDLTVSVGDWRGWRTPRINGASSLSGR